MALGRPATAGKFKPGADAMIPTLAVDGYKYELSACISLDLDPHTPSVTWYADLGRQRLVNVVNIYHQSRSKYSLLCFITVNFAILAYVKHYMLRGAHLGK